MHRSLKQQLLQKSSHLLLENNVHESTQMLRTELSEELNVESVHNSHLRSQSILHKNKR